jgi:radical SAM protein with 4Fe4S-binding SPASM domain
MNNVSSILKIVLPVFFYSRFGNSLKILSSYYCSRLFNRPLVWGCPAGLTIEPTNHCNLRCPECPSGMKSLSRPQGFINKELFEQIIEHIFKKTSYLLLHFQGEPFLHPQLMEMIRYAKKKRMYVSLSTNGHFLDDEIVEKIIESGLDRITISLDGTTPEIYEKYRVGGDMEKVIGSAEKLVAFKKKSKARHLKIVFQFIVLGTNEHQILDARNLAKKTGVDKIIFKSAQIYHPDKEYNLVPSIYRYSRYRKMENGNFRIKSDLPDHCKRLWFYSVITWDGNMLPCCFDKDAKYAGGNLKERSFKEVWTGRPMNEFRNKILLERKSMDICNNCSEGLNL